MSLKVLFRGRWIWLKKCTKIVNHGVFTTIFLGIWYQKGFWIGIFLKKQGVWPKTEWHQDFISRFCLSLIKSFSKCKKKYISIISSRLCVILDYKFGFVVVLIPGLCTKVTLHTLPDDDFWIFLMNTKNRNISKLNLYWCISK